jgi:glycosyltransferase involved in cell wall biosynthesis
VLQVSNSSVQHGAAAIVRRKDLQLAPGYREAIYFNPFIFLGNRILRAAHTARAAASLLPPILRPGRRIAAEIARHRVILFEHPDLFDIAAPHLRDDHFVVLDSHNIESDIFAHLIDKKGLAGAGARALLSVEQRCMRRADLIFACSPRDRETAIEEFGVDPARIHLAPNGVDVASTPFVTDEERLKSKQRLGLSGTTALFVGSRWPANAEAAANIVAMAPVRPEITYIVVGAVGKALPRKLPRNIIVSGVVDDLRPWLAAADLAINPMQSGSGSNVKIFEYCAAGLPTISTSFGARGIDDPEERVLTTCELSAFPHRIISTATGDDLMARRIAARALAERKYDWTMIASGIASKINAGLEAKGTC